MGNGVPIKRLDDLALSFNNCLDGDMVQALNIQEAIEEIYPITETSIEGNCLAMLHVILDYVFDGYNLEDMMEEVNQLFEILIYLNDNELSDPIISDEKAVIATLSKKHTDFPEKLDDYISKLEKGTDAKEAELKVPEINKPDFIDDLDSHLENETFHIFMNDTLERLLQIEELVLRLEGNETPDPEDLNHIFRIFHTIKGEAGFFGAKELMNFAHEIESNLDGLRKKHTGIDKHLSDELFDAKDIIETYIHLLQDREIEKLRNYCFTEDCVKLAKLNNPESHDDTVPNIEESETTESEYVEETEDIDADKTPLTGNADKQTVTNRATRGKPKKDEFIRVRASHIAELNDRIQELWITENQLEGEFLRDVKKITKEVQYLAMKLRTGSLRKLEPRLQRIVRDVGYKTNRDVQLSFVGEDIEVDRNLIEALEEPLLHIVRNSIDHGIEDPAERERQGKPKTGSITISSSRKGSRIQLTIKDDGRGLQVSKIKARALERGIITKEIADKMNKEEAFQLIFEPGFSTASQVSDLSGRGVGMDVVRDMAEQNNGRILIESEEGKHSTIHFSFPLNTAILEGMVVQYDANHFVIPVNEVVECIEVTSKIMRSVKHELPVINLRDKFIPVLRIGDLFGEKVEKAMRRSAVILNSHNKMYALLVDKIIQKNEVAIKPLSKQFRHIRGLSSATIFSGGKIGFVIDTEELIRASLTKARIKQEEA